jgi:hypothetical protein
MKITKTQKRKALKKQNITKKQLKSGKLVINLNDYALRRLRVLSEKKAINTVLNEAVMSLWEHYYPAVITTPTKPNKTLLDVLDIPTENDKSDENKGEKARTLHVQGMYIEDIAAELDWSCEKVQSALTQTDELTTPTTPATDTQSLMCQIKTLREAGMSLSAIAQKFNQDNVPTVSGSGKWHHGAISRLLR